MGLIAGLFGAAIAGLAIFSWPVPRGLRTGFYLSRMIGGVSR